MLLRLCLVTFVHIMILWLIPSTSLDILRHPGPTCRVANHFSSTIVHLSTFSSLPFFLGIVSRCYSFIMDMLLLKSLEHSLRGGRYHYLYIQREGSLLFRHFVDHVGNETDIRFSSARVVRVFHCVRITWCVVTSYGVEYKLNCFGGRVSSSLILSDKRRCLPL